MMTKLGLSLLLGLLFCATSNGQPKAAQMIDKGERARIDDINGEVVFPSVLDIEIIIDDEEPVICTAGKLTGAQRPMSAVHSYNKVAARGRRVKQASAFYVDDDGSYEMTSVSNGDGSVTTNVRGVIRPRPGRKCWMSHGQTRCWDVNMDGKYDEDIHLLGRPTYKPSLELIQKMKDAQNSTSRRNKRSPSFQDYLPSKVVEILYIVDKPMVDWFMLIHDDNESVAIDDMTAYINLMNNEGTFMYGSIKEHVNLDLQLMGVVLLYPPIGTEWSWVAPHKTGNKLNVRYPFGAWRSYRDWANAGNLDQYKFDIAAVISGSDLSYGTSPSTLGIALLDVVCKSSKAKRVVFNEDLYADAVFTLVHELAHALGALHDGDRNNCNPTTHLMAPSLIYPSTSNKNMYRTFSACSAVQIKEHLDDHPDCLSDHNETEYLESLCKGVRGDRFNVDFNCQKALRIENSKFCGPAFYKNIGQVPANACWDNDVITCSDADGNCVKMLYNMFDGTPCRGEKKNSPYVCYKGNCIPKYEICPSECRCSQTKRKSRRRCCAANKKVDGTCCSGCRLTEDKKGCQLK